MRVQTRVSWPGFSPQPTFLLPLLPLWKQDFPPCASAGPKNPRLVTEGHLAAETLGFWRHLTQAGNFLEERDEPNGETETQREQRACL